MFYVLKKKNLTAVLERLKRQEEEAKALKGRSEEANTLQTQMTSVQKEKEKVDKNLKEVKIQVSCH